MTAPLRTVIVDDEERARRRLARMLAAEPRVVVVAEAASGAEALTAIARHAPDLVFLDVQMPDLDGFGVLAQLPRPPRAVIFTTAYDRYALDAFKVGALDYLLKPFGEADLARAVARAAERGADEARAAYDRTMAALARPRYLERLPVTHRQDIVLVPVAEVASFEANAELVDLHAAGAVYSTELTLAELESRLDPERFFRVHRKTIVNLDRVVRLTPTEGGRLLAQLADGRAVEVSRQGARRLREKLGV
jgi:two-component system LytT family response regulator